MIAEPPRDPMQPRRGRNNNLLCLAAILLMIGLTTLQVSIVLAPLLAMYMPLDSVFWTILLIIGIIPTLGGVYVMYRWYHSGE
ncbi:MAG: hypothetical protein KAU48_12170 [Candidatus Thorarchaeota archaeon]|nr:hypothetical protein [Candidatus Thorarchaeota archaeon]